MLSTNKEGAAISTHQRYTMPPEEATHAPFPVAACITEVIRYLAKRVQLGKTVGHGRHQTRSERAAHWTARPTTQLLIGTPSNGRYLGPIFSPREIGKCVKLV
jgi:hypothetical protein